jgi:hypothetical protein
VVTASIIVCGDQSNNSRVLQIAAAQIPSGASAIKRLRFRRSWVNGRFTLRKSAVQLAKAD